MLQADDEVTGFRCNVLLEGLAEGEYTSDFVCEKKSGEITQKMIFAFSLSKNANPLSHLQVQFESALATHPLCYNLISNKR